MLLAMECTILLIISLYTIFATVIDDISNLVFAIIILVVASVETIIGLLLLINFANQINSITVDK